TQPRPLHRGHVFIQKPPCCGTSALPLQDGHSVLAGRSAWTVAISNCRSGTWGSITTKYCSLSVTRWGSRRLSITPASRPVQGPRLRTATGRDSKASEPSAQRMWRCVSVRERQVLKRTELTPSLPQSCPTANVVLHKCGSH